MHGLGYFRDQEDAAAAYDAEAQRVREKNRKKSLSVLAALDPFGFQGGVKELHFSL